jgi:heme exporter protein A
MTERQAIRADISLDKVAIVRSGRLILRDFDLQVESGEAVWVRGANGSGKSTLLRTIAGLLQPTAGKVAITGSMGLCDDSLALDIDRSLDDALAFWARLDGVSPAQLEKALEVLDLVPLAELPVRLLSAGQRRRGALARLIAGGTDIWLLDEPYNGLDQANVTRLDVAIQRHCETGGIALIASHISPTINVARSLTLDRADSGRQAA